MGRPWILATRGSELAVAQSSLVADALRAQSGRDVELLILSTRGDRIQDRPLAKVGGKGLFTKEIERALLDGQADLAVHSMKDLPTENPPELMIGAIPEREDPRDVLVGASLTTLAQGAVVGTGSARRAAQLRAVRPDLTIVGVRGNVGTRVQKQRDGHVDAVVLAAAGLRRLGMEDVISQLLDPEDMTPAVGQGALAVQCRRADESMRAALAQIHHSATGTCIDAERAFLIRLEGGCSVPAACQAVLHGDELQLRGAFEVDGELRRAVLQGSASDGERLGRELAERLLQVR